MSSPFDPELLSWLPRRRRWGALLAALTGLRAVVVVAQALLLAHALVLAFGGSSPAGPLLLLVIVATARALLHAATEAAAREAAVRLRSALRQQLTRHVVGMGPVWLAGPGGRGLSTLLTEGVDDLDSYISSFVPQLAQAAVVPAVVLLAIGGLDPESLIVLLLTLPLLPLFLALVGMHTRKETAAQYAGLARLTDHFLDVVVGLPTLTVFGRAQQQVAVLRDLSLAHQRRTMRVLRTAFLSGFALELLATLSVAVVAVLLGFRLLDGQVSLSTALGVLLLAPEAFLPVRAVGSSYHAAAAGLTVAAAAKQVLHTPLPRAVAGSAMPPAGVLTVEGISATYSDGTVGLLDVSLEVQPGECVAVMGDSGCGKSTLLLALLGLVPLTAGRITVGGRDLAECDGDAWRDRVAYVPQRPWLFAGSIEDNIRLGRPAATQQQLQRAVRDAHVDEFLPELPGGLATLLGERGLGLSLGQQRRVALARAFLRDVSVVLLDEPTADLDVRSEVEIVAALRVLARDRTVVVTTHRGATFAGWTRSILLASPAVRESA